MNTRLPDLPSIVSNKQKLSDNIYDVICEYIVKGKIVAGQRLREAEVAESLSVSRTPVREAFARLEMQHLLERDSTGAYLVANWDSQRLWEVASLRTTLDGMAIRLASELMKPADYDFLKSVIMQMEAAYLRKDYDALIDLDIQFHSYIWGRTNHLLLCELLEGMKAQVRFLMYLTRPGDEESYGSTHQELLDIMRDGDHGKLNQTISDHILATAERAIERIENK
ncbi:MAG: GntR family transcriptional regulator [Anaerolineales bacterium]